jgi:hypothetical protein
VVAEVCPVAKTRVADTISLDGGPSRALGATVEGPDPTGSRQDQSGGPECRPVNPREGGEPSEPARRAPQQPAISPAKKIRPDRCGTATLSLSLSLQTLQSRRVSGSTDSLADATRTAAITGGRRQAKSGRLPPGGPSRIPPALLDRLSKSSARGPSAVTSSLLAIRAGRGAPRPPVAGAPLCGRRRARLVRGRPVIESTSECRKLTNQEMMVNTFDFATTTCDVERMRQRMGRGG